MAEQKPMHPCEWFSQVAEPVLDSSPKLDLQFGGFFDTEEEFELCWNSVCFQFWKYKHLQSLLGTIIKL